jgi:hypothetical protein
MESDAIGYWSPWTILWFGLFSVAPLAYLYIVLMLLRDLCVSFPGSIYEPLQLYVPFLARLADRMKGSSWLVDFWCVIEALFFICFQLKFRYLQSKDPLEASLSAAPMYDPEDRKVLWDRIMDAEKEDPRSFISGWFFDEPIGNISRYDVCDFFCWCMFDGRNQEHLTLLELHELESFVEEIEYRISIQLHGAQPETEKGGTINKENESVDRQQNNKLKDGRLWSPKRLRMNSDDSMSEVSDLSSFSARLYPLPNKSKFQMGLSGVHVVRLKLNLQFVLDFRFQVDIDREEPNFFSNLYESYKHRYEHYKTMVESSDFHPVKDFRTFVHETAHHADESARATAHNMYEMIVQPGSNMDKHIAALSQATSSQLAEAWNSVKGMKERIETANFLSQQRDPLMQQLRGNQALLTKLREMPYAVPSIFAKKEPQRYAKYSSDPLLSIKTYPLGFHLLVLGGTEIPMRMMLKNRGFEKRHIGPLSYYYYPGIQKDTRSKEKAEKMPIVFVHGIGVGLLTYMNLINYFLKTGRPIFLPLIPYVSGFRPWLSSNSVLTPTVVASTVSFAL